MSNPHWPIVGEIPSIHSHEITIKSQPSIHFFGLSDVVRGSAEKPYIVWEAGACGVKALAKVKSD
jgi:hypothetical protein